MQMTTLWIIVCVSKIYLLFFFDLEKSEMLPFFRFPVMSDEYLKFSNSTRCLSIQQRKLFGMKILYQLNITLEKVWLVIQ